MRVKEMIKNQGTFKTMLGLAVVALLLISCDSGSKGSDPQVEDSSSSVTDPASSGSVITSSGSVITSSSSAKSSSSTQINSSGSTQSSSSGVLSSSSGESCEEEGATKRSYQDGVWTKYICTSGAWVVYVASSSSAASSSSYYDMDSTFSYYEFVTLSYGEFTDPRDGQMYKTIKASSYEDYEYFAENLNYGVQVSGTSGQLDDNVVEKYCYNDDPWYCDHYFGGLYQWSEAMGFPSACNDVKAGSTTDCPDSIVLPTGHSEPELFVQHQGICPDGWHIMSEDEWSIVIGGGASTLKSQVLWRVHNNSKGLSILPAGYRDSTGAYSYLGSQAYFWLPQEHSTDINRSYLSYITKNEVSNGGAWIRKTTGMSVRCVKDHEGL